MAVVSLKFGESFMDLVSHFNLQAKTIGELKGLYIELFNKLGDRNISKLGQLHINAIFYMVKNTIVFRM